MCRTTLLSGNESIYTLWCHLTKEFEGGTGGDGLYDTQDAWMCIYIRFEATPEAAGFIPKQRHKTPSTRRVSYSRAAKGHVNVRFTTKTGIRALATRSGRGLWWCERLYCHCWANTIHGNDVARLNATTELQCLMCCICVCVRRQFQVLPSRAPTPSSQE